MGMLTLPLLSGWQEYIYIYIYTLYIYVYIVTYSGFYSRRNLYCTPKSQYTTVKYSRKLFEHTYTSDPHGLGTLIPIEFFQHDLLWQSLPFLQSESYQTHVGTIHRRAIGPLAHHNGTAAYSPSLACHLPAPTIECLHRPRYKLTCSSHNFLIRT
jgi:hypothetical protein